MRCPLFGKLFRHIWPDRVCRIRKGKTAFTAKKGKDHTNMVVPFPHEGCLTTGKGRGSGSVQHQTEHTIRSGLKKPHSCGTAPESQPSLSWSPGLTLNLSPAR